MDIFLGFIIFSLSHISYICILNYLDLYILLCKQKSIRPYLGVHYIVIITKILQGLFIIFLVKNICNNFRLESIPFIVLNYLCIIILGQYLNYQVYNTIGVKGVCYGLYLHESISLINDYAFNIPYINHFQYLGAWMSYISIFNIIKYSMICDANKFNEITILQCYITMLYTISSWIECFFHQQYVEKNSSKVSFTDLRLLYLKKYK